MTEPPLTASRGHQLDDKKKADRDSKISQDEGDAALLAVMHVDLVAPPGGDVVAFAVTFVFLDQQGEPTDLDRDGYLDAAATEIYLNDRFLWSTEGVPGTIDLETVALHELGHALGIGHVESLAEAVMNPVYAGPRRELQPLDQANLCVVR